MKVQVKSIRESHWGQYSSDDCWDEYDILMNHDAVDFCEMCNSSEGSAIADQLCDILTGEEELKDQNPNALEYIKQFCERKGEVDLADAITRYLEDEGQDGTLDKFMESTKKDSNKSVKKESKELSDELKSRHFVVKQDYNNDPEQDWVIACNDRSQADELADFIDNNTEWYATSNGKYVELPGLTTKSNDSDVLNLVDTLKSLGLDIE